jgi:uncharacterized damage-inducible protein DinB
MKPVLLALAAAYVAFGQAPDFKTASGGARSHYGQISGLLVRSAEKMPEENYSFKPTPEVRSFGALVGHVADAQYAFCSAAMGEKNPAPGVEKSKTSKADLVTALKDAVAYCKKAYDGLNDENAGQSLKFFGGERSKLNILQFNNMHNMEHYGNMVTYLRIKGLVPPSSERRQ